MKQFKYIAILVTVVSILGSCGISHSGFGSGNIQKRKYTKGFYIYKKNHLKTSKPDATSSKELQFEDTESVEVIDFQKLDAKDVQQIASKELIPTPKQVSKQNESKKSSTKKKDVAKKQVPVKQRKPRESEYYIPVKKDTVNQKMDRNAGGSSDSMFIVAVILAIIIPPVGVAVYTNVDWKKVLIALLLWLLFILPGVIYALLVVFDIL